MLELAIRHRLGSFEIAAALQAEGGLIALFGRSGSGKTSLVNMIAGLIRPAQGRIALDGRTLFDDQRGVFVPSHKRRIGYVFQEPRLFPHLNVRHNLLYGRWFAPKTARAGNFDAVVELLGIAHLLGRRPGLLSGGEKQRVAIGRALLANPRLLLMDEPLASLDEPRKAEILPYIEALRDETRIPIVYVSHSVAEITRLATTVALMTEGRIVAFGPTQQVMARVDLFPLTGRYEAGAILHATVVGHDLAYDLSTLRTTAGELRVPRLDLPIGSAVRMRVRGRDVTISVRAPQGLSALNSLPATIAEIGPANGAIADLKLDCGGQPLLARVTRKAIDALDLRAGRHVYAIVKSTAFDRQSLSSARLPDQGER